jgi:hypothetical protein
MLALCMLSLYMFIRGLAVEQETLDAALGNGKLSIVKFHFLKEIPSPRSESFEERSGKERSDSGVGLELGQIELEERML